jgi:His-Xaa-Ser repeat protein HxsA
MTKKLPIISSLLAAGLPAMDAAALTPNTPGVPGDTDRASADLPISSLHVYTLAQHRSHRSHGSHGSHESHGSHRSYMGPSLGLNGGEAEADQAVKAGRNTQSVPPSSVLPASPEIAKATLKHLPGNSAKFRTIVLRVQVALHLKGYFSEPFDGLMHARTMAAIYDYQSKHGLEPSARLTPEFLGSLGIVAE